MFKLIVKTVNALKEITKGEGAYSMEKLKHASNTIDNMKSLAKKALEDLNFHLSPYNPAHAEYSDCPGIFNALNDDLEVVCNECNMKLTELIDEIIGKNNG